MMKLINTTMLIALLCFTAINISYSQIKSFAETLKSANMQFDLPKNHIETPTIDNKSMLYSYAYQDEAKNYEVRYRIDLLDSNYNQANNPATMLAVLFNISDKSIEIPELSKRVMVIKPELVKQDFNGDAAFASLIKTNKDFNKDFSNCFMTLLYKTDVANVWMFILFDDFEKFKETGSKITSALKFKK
jgi:hypothetical protein